MLAFTKRDGKSVLIAHAVTEKGLLDAISDAVKKGKYDRDECIFYE